jgi:hypothetical protein
MRARNRDMLEKSVAAMVAAINIHDRRGNKNTIPLDFQRACKKDDCTVCEFQAG